MTNTVPPNYQAPFRSTVTQFDRPLISQAIVSAEQELKGFDEELERIYAEIDRLKRAAIVLEDRRQVVERKVAEYRSLLAPVNRMPPEVMTEIFKFCCENNSIYDWYKPWAGKSVNTFISSAVPSVVTLSMVCGRWREMVLSTPSLWASIEIAAVANFPTSSIFRAIEMFTKRSHNTPLSLRIRHDTDHPPEYLRLLACSSSRWERLDLSVPTSGISTQMLEDLRGALPALTHLRLFFHAQPHPHHPILRVFEVAPSLRSVDLGRDEVTLALPWHQLQSVRLTHVSPSHFMPVLSRCSNAEEIHINDILGSEPYSGNNHVYLPIVKKFAVQMYMKKERISVLQHLTLRGLQTLRVMDYAFFSWKDLRLQEFLHRSNPPLTSLYLKWVAIRARDMIALLEPLPALRVLSVEEKCYESDRNPHDRTITSEFLNRLSLHEEWVENPNARASAASIVPQLAELLLGTDVIGLDQEALFKAVASRCPDGEDNNGKLNRCLRSVGLKIFSPGPNRSVTTLKSLVRFRDAGVRIRIDWSGYPLDEEGSI